MERNLAGSLAMMNALTPKLGYHRVKELYEKAPSPPASLEELAALVARETGTPLEEVRSWLSPGRLAGMNGGNA
jgi:fumarate hydratase class II